MKCMRSSTTARRRSRGRSEKCGRDQRWNRSRDRRGGVGLRTDGRSNDHLLLGLLLTAGLVCVHAAAPLAAPPRVEGPTLRLDEALARALGENKRIEAFAYRLQEEDGLVEQAGLIPNPELRVELEQAVGSGLYKGFARSETTISLEWVIEGSRRGHRVDAARARKALRSTEAEIVRLDVAAATAGHFIDSLAGQARLTTADRSVLIAEEAVAAVERHVAAGKAPSADLIRAQAELALVRIARDDAVHVLSSSHQLLAAQWGEVRPGFSGVAGDLLALPRVVPLEALLERIEQNPQLARLASRAKAAEADLGLAKSRRWPLIRPAAGFRRYEASDDYALAAELKVPLPVFDRNQGSVSASRAAIAATRADANAVRVRVNAALFSSYQELQHQLHRAQTLREDVIPRFEIALEQTRRAYERGRYSYFEWRSVQDDLLVARNALVDASAGVHHAVIELERLTGQKVANR